MSSFYDLIFDEKKIWDKELLITNVKGYSLRDMHTMVDKFINLLQAEGDINGKKVASLIPNLPTYFSLLIAVNKLGGTFIPLSHQYRSEDLANVLNLTTPNIIISVKAQNGIPFKEMISEWAKSKKAKTVLFFYDEGKLNKQVIPGNEDRLRNEKVDFIACTSGSTGVPKGIKLKANAINHWTEGLLWGLELKQNDRIFLTIPNTTPYGICWLLTCFKHQIQMVIPEGFDIPIVMNLLKEYPCNKIATTPSLFKGIFMFANKISPASLEHFELGSLAGEQVSDDFIKLMKEFKSCRLKNSYGLSEQGVLMFSNDIRSDVVEWSVVEGNGNQFKVNDISSDGSGELMFKTSFGFDGYYLNDELTQDSFTKDGWFYTGDLVRVNNQNKIELIGRKKQMIKKGGVQVIPAEVERVLNQYPMVLQSAVVGIPHSTYGEDIIAFIVSEPELSLQELYSFTREKISSFKVPSKIIEINEMPIIQGKLDKVTLGKMALEIGGARE
ncbi:class I adenylate-forming enzyme family protein [Bacillus solitudinis]|uniref:class I adenylate-forming enzyme family protein n=1 Tax=Bacillus solitudinis TaxID=2014074 RepID=UPI000C242D17|nr:class I adenylate-forming enzyme family protein [Bacillus solitudinis]